jgi:cation transport ATPase
MVLTNLSLGESRRVYVHHDIALISASSVKEALSHQGFPTLVVEDGSAQVAARKIAESTESSPWTPSPAGSAYVESTLVIADLWSNEQAHAIRKVFEQRFLVDRHVSKEEDKAIRAVHIHTASHTCKVEHNPTKVSIAAICDSLINSGFQSTIATDGAAEGLVLPQHLPEDQNTAPTGSCPKQRTSLVLPQAQLLRVNVIFSGIFWVFALFSAVAGWHSFEYCGLLAVVFGLPHVAVKAWRTILRSQFDSNCMMVTAALGALALGEFEEAASVSFLFSISEYLEARASEKARKAISDIVQLRPERKYTAQQFQSRESAG